MLLFAALLAYISTFLKDLPFFVKMELGLLTSAVLIGMLIGNTFFVKIAEHTGRGIDFAKNKLLRLGVILYGLDVTFQQIIGVGGRGIIIVISVFFPGLFLGKKLFSLNKENSILISTGSAICGAAAIMVAEPVLKAQAHKATIAAATVVVFGTISMFYIRISILIWVLIRINSAFISGLPCMK